MGGFLPPFGLMFLSPLKIDLGVITSFAGGLGNIPPGWFLCDGNNGTPDLRNKFVPATGPIFAVGDEGGAANHIHDYAGDGHEHNFSSGTTLKTGTSTDDTTESGVALGTTDPGITNPPFFALAYIQFRGDS